MIERFLLGRTVGEAAGKIESARLKRQALMNDDMVVRVSILRGPWGYPIPLGGDIATSAALGSLLSAILRCFGRSETLLDLAVEVNHIAISARDQRASARLLAYTLGLEVGPA